MPSKIRIAIVDDHPMVRRGVSETLSEEADFKLVGVGESAQDAITMARQERPDIVLLDIALAGGGIEAAREIAREHPEIKVVMLTVREDQTTVKAALRAGARGYLAKGVDGPELVGALRRIHAGQSYVTPTLAAQLLAEANPSQRTADQPGRGSSARLTEREEQIMSLLGEGLSNHAIGRKLGLTENTIKHYMTSLLQKLGAKNRTEAALLARERSPGVAKT
jgi:two-component system, NarL family, nitrate/nitrite response regulator NarL